MTATLLLTAPAAAGVLRIPARAAVAFVKNKAAKAACDMSRYLRNLSLPFQPVDVSSG